MKTKWSWLISLDFTMSTSPCPSSLGRGGLSLTQKINFHISERRGETRRFRCEQKAASRRRWLRKWTNHVVWRAAVAAGCSLLGEHVRAHTLTLHFTFRFLASLGIEVEGRSQTLSARLFPFRSKIRLRPTQPPQLPSAEREDGYRAGTVQPERKI